LINTNPGIVKPRAQQAALAVADRVLRPDVVE
jgi:hypothetical protein